jgi:hypothetical protein
MLEYSEFEFALPRIASKSYSAMNGPSWNQGYLRVVVNADNIEGNTIFDGFCCNLDRTSHHGGSCIDYNVIIEFN